MTLHLVDIQVELAEAWKVAFSSFPEVMVHYGDILQLAVNTIASPANKHGFVDGGIGLQCRELFGTEVERRVQEAIRARPEGYLPVGTAGVVETGHPRVPYLVLAPTMEMPEAVPAAQAYRALRAVLRRFGSDPVREIFCPGLGIRRGHIPVRAAAREMAGAYQDWSEAKSP